MITLYEYLSGNIQLPQNVKDYIYTKLGTKRYQLIDLGDNVKWRTVKMGDASSSSKGKSSSASGRDRVIGKTDGVYQDSSQ